VFNRLLRYLWDARLNSTIAVKAKGKYLFAVCDFGPVTRMRAKTFEVKEPDTLKWIDSFKEGDTLLDIGANIGIYSMYSALHGIRTVCVEPDALNFALLNLNTRLNSLGGLINSYCVAVYDACKYSLFYSSSNTWGGALSSFDQSPLESIQYSRLNSESYVQGCYGTTLDRFLDSIDFFPSHIKIDVDGNELAILRGATSTLHDSRLKSLLIELDESDTEYEDCISQLESSGLHLVSKQISDHVKNAGLIKSISNHIFCRLQSTN